MVEWVLKDKQLKNYPHFDGRISKSDAVALATNPKMVATHPFYPFLLYSKSWNKFAKKGKQGKPKTRPIRYAARKDAYIFAYYRHLLSELYEQKIAGTAVAESVIAYRRLKCEETGGGKCNIHFARDAFNGVRVAGDCFVITLDISSFFESLDHDYLKKIWCSLLNKTRLPDDHFQVFKAMTKYSVVDKKEAYERLGHFGAKRKSISGTPIKGYLTKYEHMPKHLCSGDEFRKLIAGSNGNKSLIKKNHKPYGIPQGAPISDLLANIYLIEFDKLVAAWAKALGGKYFRYSDDILLIVKCDEVAARELSERVRNLIPTFGKKLEIQEKNRRCQNLSEIKASRSTVGYRDSKVKTDLNI